MKYIINVWFLSLTVCIYMHICVYVYTHMYVYVYGHIYRKPFKQKKIKIHLLYFLLQIWNQPLL